MTLTEDDKQQLRALLDNNREGKCDSDHIVDLGPVTDDTTFVARRDILPAVNGGASLQGDSG